MVNSVFWKAYAILILGCLAALTGATLRLAFDNAPLVHDALWNVKAATWNISQASGVLEENSTQAATEEKKILGEVSEFIKLTNLQLYGPSGHPGLIPQTTLLVKKAQPVMDNLVSATSRLNDAIANLNKLLQTGNASVQDLQASEHRLETLIEDLDNQVSDPEIKLILANLLTSVRNGAKSMEELAATSTDVRQIADKARDTYLKPVNLWWGLVKELLPLAGSAAQVVK